MPYTELQNPAFSFEEGVSLFAFMRKVAGELEEGAEQLVETATGEEPSPAEATVGAATGAPDVTGRMEGEFLSPMPEVLQTMQNLVGVLMKIQLAYNYFAELVRGPERESFARMFRRGAEEEAKDISYILRRMAVLTEGSGMPLPPIPPPPPLTDVPQILEHLIAAEQQAVVFLKTLRAHVGENVMRYTIDQMLSREQAQIDRLWQHMPAAKPESGMQQKAAAFARFLKKQGADAALMNTMGAPPGQIPDITQLLVREHAGQVAQLSAEREELVHKLQHTEAVNAASTARAESAEAEAQIAQQQAQAAQEQATMASQQAQQATEQAAMSEEQAANQAQAKMRLMIRLQQLRQGLADMASQDPAAEEGLSFGQAAGPGSITTDTQQAAAAQEQAAMQEQAAATQGLPKEQKKEVDEAQRAQSEAQEQTSQAQQATTKTSVLRLLKNISKKG